MKKLANNKHNYTLSASRGPSWPRPRTYLPRHSVYNMNLPTNNSNTNNIQHLHTYISPNTQHVTHIPDPNDHFGDDPRIKRKQACRLLFHNIGGLAARANDIQNRLWRDTLRDFNVDVCGISEVNLNWRKINEADQLYSRALAFWGSAKTQVAFNAHANDAPRRHHGGTALVAIGPAASCVGDSGADPSGLGRWAWFELRRDRRTVIVSAYRPTATGSGPDTVANQHRSFLRTTNDDRCPRKAFLDDLGQAIDNWHQEGRQVIVGMDANTNVTGPELAEWSKAHDLCNVLADSHAHLPPTFDRGSSPIDGIFASNAIDAFRCGLLGFGYGIPSQHRACWIDVPFRSLLGRIPTGPVKPSARRLKLQDPRTVSRYISAVRRHFAEHRLIQRVTALVDNHHAPLTPAEAAELEDIDRSRTEGMLLAEQGCRRLRTGAADWSPKLTQAIIDHRYIALLRKKQSGGRVSSTLLRRLRRRSSVVPVGSLPSLDLESLIRQTRQALDRALISASCDRDTFIFGLAQAKSEAGHQDTASMLRTLRLREHDRKTWRIIRRVFKPPRNEVTSVTAPDANGVWREVFSKPETEDGCLFESEGRFRQTEHTPSLNEPLLSRLGPRGNGPEADDVLDGVFLAPEEISECTRLVLSVLKRPPEARALPSDTWITPQEWTSLWNKTNEHTSSGKSGLHFGMFKAHCSDRFLAAFDVAMANLSFSTGYTLRRWKPSINVMIPKKASSTRVDKQRIIHLWEADANANFKILARKAMAAGERNNMLAREQYGSRKDLSAQALCLTKRLVFDVSRQQRLPIALCANDARQCYDRIVHGPAALALRRLGAPKQPVESMFAMIQNLQHCVRTAFGDSDKFYDSHTLLSGQPARVPIQGIGQGNGCGPATWAAISSVLLEALRRNERGLLLRSAIGKNQFLYTGFAFVDDTDTFESARPDDLVPTAVITRLQESIDLWEGCLSATGGALNPAKSFWSLAAYKWVRGELRYCTEVDAPGAVHMKDRDGTPVEVQRIPPSKGLETLGIHLAADGNNKDQIEAMTKESRTMAHQLTCSNMADHMVQRVVLAVAGKKLAYPLAATTLRDKDCEKIIQPFREAALPALGYSRKMPKIVAHAPMSFGGIGLPDLAGEQLASRIQHLVQFGTSDTPTGETIRTTIENIKLEIGNGRPLFDNDFDEWSRLTTTTWIQATWGDCFAAGIHLSDPTANLQLLCAGDHFLNTLALDQGLSGEARSGINQCRLYFRVSTVADICRGDGTDVANLFLHYPSKLMAPQLPGWPNCHRPGRKAWKHWKDFVQSIRAHTTVARLPLGPWHHDVHDRALCQSWIHPATAMVYRQTTTGTWKKWHRSSAGLRSLAPSNDAPIHSIPNACVPSVSQRTRRGTRIIDSGARPTAPTPGRPTTFADFLASLPPEARWAVWPAEGVEHGATLAKALQEGRLIGVSDGSHVDRVATAAWTLLATTHDGIPMDSGHDAKITGVFQIPGAGSDQDSFRAELGGIYGQVSFILALCKFFHIDSGSATIGLDGLSALREATFISARKDSIRQHFDLVNSIRRILRRLPVTINGRHVKGHQDRDTPRDLDHWALLNIEMDNLARSLAKRLASSADIPVALHAQGVLVTIDGLSVSKNLLERVRAQRIWPHIMEYWAAKFGWTIELTAHVDWEARGIELQKAQPGRRRFVIQHSTGFSGVGRKLHQQNSATPATCPRCNQEETERHIPRCNGREMAEQKQKALAKFRTAVKKAKTAPRLAVLLVAAVERYLMLGQTINPNEISEQDTSALIAEQNEIGIHEMLLGHLSLRWRDMQRSYFALLPNGGSALRWTRRIIAALWDVFWGFWAHRNMIKHASKKAATNETASNDINARIRRLWDRGRRTLPPHDRTIFHGSLRTMLESSLYHRRQWVEQAENVFARAARRLDEQHGGERRLMRNWLQRAEVN